jgi:protein O-GlcNAc transferase
MSYIDYLIADSIVIPPGEDDCFAEQLVRLPQCYQINDDRRPIASVPARDACGLPSKGFVFCCFNSAHKITPAFFQIWMRLLRQVPDSVLWLLNTPAYAEHVAANLRREASASGVASERLVFAPRLLPEQNLARLALADLSLDCLPYNQHTTGSDALWAGVPLLSCRGASFAGRVAASLLHAVGLPEMVTESIEDYEELALRLAREPQTLHAIRLKLAQNRLNAPLFDTRRTTRDIEAAYGRMWQMFLEGEVPRGFSVPL